MTAPKNKQKYSSEPRDLSADDLRRCLKHLNEISKREEPFDWPPENISGFDPGYPPKKNLRHWIDQLKNLFRKNK